MILLLAVLHAVAAAAFWQASADWRVRGAALVLVLASLMWAWRGERENAGRTLILRDDGLLGVSRAGSDVAARLLPGSTDFGWAVWLQWRTGGEGWRRRGALMLLPDHLPPESWRPLRAWLRHKAAVGIDAGSERRGRSR